MGFLDVVNTILRSGMVGVVAGFVLYFLVLVVCKFWDLQGLWRAGLTVVAVILVIVPDAWELAFQADNFRNFGAPVAATPEGLWLSIKTMLILGPGGHVLGLFAEKKLLN